MDNKTAWYDQEKIPKAMLDAASGIVAGWKQLEDSDHFSALKQSIERCNNSKTILDLGCGAGEVSRVFKNLDYTGADLSHIIEKVAKKKNPNSKYINFDANLDDFSFLNGFDVILMNSFLSEIPDYFKVLNKVLFYSKKYIVIHRQQFDERDSRIENYSTYSNLMTTKTIINYKEFFDLCYRNNFSIVLNIDSFGISDANKTLVLERQND